MPNRIIQSHLQEGGYRRCLAVSVLAHIALFLLVLGIGWLLPATPIQLGTGLAGSGGGDFMTVGLAADISGGQGMYKPALKPSAEVAPLPQRQSPSPKETEVAPDETVFVEKVQPEKPPAKADPVEAKPQRQTPTAAKTQQEVKTGSIPQEPSPGRAGPMSGSPGSGAGFGPGRGLSLGPGSGEGGIDSWYIRQVEQRIGRNWLQTSLGQVENRVEAIVTFEVERSGRIGALVFERRSGLPSVDLAVQRAIQASDPLPPPPHTLGNRTIHFRAIFEHPPR